MFGGISEGSSHETVVFNTCLERFTVYRLKTVARNIRIKTHNSATAAK